MQCNFYDTLTNKSKAKSLAKSKDITKLQQQISQIIIITFLLTFYRLFLQVLWCNTLHPKCIWLHFYPNYHWKLICIGPKRSAVLQHFPRLPLCMQFSDDFVCVSAFCSSKFIQFVSFFAGVLTRFTHNQFIDDGFFILVVH